MAPGCPQLFEIFNGSDIAVHGEGLGCVSMHQTSKENKGWNNKIMGREGIVAREGRRTVVILGEPEGVPRPYGEELISIAAKSM